MLLIQFKFFLLLGVTVLIRINPTKVLVSGDINRAKRFIGPAKSQFNILKDQLNRGNLSQGIRRVHIDEETYIECKNIYNQQQVKIYVTPSEDEDDIQESENHLLVVYGNYEHRLDVVNITGTFNIGESISYGEEGSGTISFIEDSSTGKYLYGSFSHIDPYGLQVFGESSKASGEVVNCYRRHYQRQYNYEEIINNAFGSIDFDIELNTAFENSPLGNQSCLGTTQNIIKEWSKVYDDVILVAYMYFDFDLGELAWGVSVSYKNIPITINGQSVHEGFIRTRVYNSGGDFSHTHIGFDLWAIENTETNVLDYFFGIIDDAGSFESFKFNIEEGDFELLNSRSSNIRTDDSIAFKDSSSHSIRNLHTFLLGYGHVGDNDYAWWGMPGLSPYYYREDLITGEFTEFNIVDSSSDSSVLYNAIWHPIERELYVYGESKGTSLNLGTFEFFKKFANHGYALPSSGLWCLYDAVTGECSSSWGCADEAPEAPLCACQSRINVNGTYHYYDAYYYALPDSLPCSGLWFGVTNWSGELRQPTSNSSYGKYSICGDEFYKGSAKSFSVSKVEMGHSTPNRTCDTSLLTWNTLSGYNKCEPHGAKRYAFQKWAWDNTGGVVYEILEDNLTTEENEDGDIVCVWENSWSTKNSGDAKILALAEADFPYDFNWTSILLHGKDVEDNEHENKVIYINSEDDFFIRDASGGTYLIGKYNRAYFTQYEQNTSLGEQ